MANISVQIENMLPFDTFFALNKGCCRKKNGRDVGLNVRTQIFVDLNEYAICLEISKHRC